MIIGTALTLPSLVIENIGLFLGIALACGLFLYLIYTKILSPAWRSWEKAKRRIEFSFEEDDYAPYRRARLYEVRVDLAVGALLFLLMGVASVVTIGLFCFTTLGENQLCFLYDARGQSLKDCREGLFYYNSITQDLKRVDASVRVRKDPLMWADKLGAIYSDLCVSAALSITHAERLKRYMAEKNFSPDMLMDIVRQRVDALGDKHLKEPQRLALDSVAIAMGWRKAADQALFEFGLSVKSIRIFAYGSPQFVNFDETGLPISKSLLVEGKIPIVVKGSANLEVVGRNRMTDYLVAKQMTPWQFKNFLNERISAIGDEYFKTLDGGKLNPITVSFNWKSLVNKQLGEFGVQIKSLPLTLEYQY